MESILEGLPAYMMVGIVVVIGVSQFHRLAGAVLSVLFWTVIAIIGNIGYEMGHSLGLPGVPFPRGVFLGICGLFMLMHSWAAWAAIQKKRREAERRQILADD